MHQLQTADYIVFFLYFIIISGYGYYIYQKKKSATTSSTDFFLAEGSLTWWAIGASLIASNISAEHFIGMSGSGFALGLAISTYEWMSAFTLILVAVFILMKKGSKRKLVLANVPAWITFKSQVISSSKYYQRV